MCYTLVLHIFYERNAISKSSVNSPYTTYIAGDGVSAVIGCAELCSPGGCKSLPIRFVGWKLEDEIEVYIVYSQETTVYA